MDTPRLLDHDTETGITEWYHFDATDGSFTIETTQDVGDLIECNQRLYNNSASTWGEMDMVARFPLTVLMDLVQRRILDPGFRVINDVAYTRWLNDRDNMVWRTKRGTV